MVWTENFTLLDVSRHLNKTCCLECARRHCNKPCLVANPFVIMKCRIDADQVISFAMTQFRKEFRFSKALAN